MSTESRKRRKVKVVKPWKEMLAEQPKRLDRQKFVRPTLETEISQDLCPICDKPMMRSVEKIGREVGEVRYYCDDCMYEEIDFGEDALTS